MSHERGSDRPDAGEPGQPVEGEPAAAPDAGHADERDPDHWLRKLTAREWVQAGLGELRRASEAYRMRQPRAGHAGARRAAGMALNGALRVAPDESWGRSYMEHLVAVSRSDEVPGEVREAAALLLEAPAPGGALVALRSASGDERLLEAARTVMAHALAVVVRAEGE